MTKRKSAEKIWEAQQTRKRMASCPSGKKRFDTEEFAAKALAKVVRKYGQTREVRFYRDPLCGGWHLTKDQGLQELEGFSRIG